MPIAGRYPGSTRSSQAEVLGTSKASELSPPPASDESWESRRRLFDPQEKGQHYHESQPDVTADRSDSEGPCCEPLLSTDMLPPSGVQWMKAAVVVFSLVLVGMLVGFNMGQRAAFVTANRALPIPAPDPGPTSVLVIGAGPAGLAVLRELQKVEKVGQLKITCFDRQQVEGGQWTGALNYSSMYSGMWINGDKSFTEYPSYTYATHYGKELGSFFPREVAYDYIKGFSDAFGLGQYITHGVEVTNVKFDEKLEKFVVKSAPSVYGKVVAAQRLEQTAHFDYVVVASGSFAAPKIITTEGFTGTQLHAKYFRDPDAYAGKNVIVVGNQDSAFDIALLLTKHKANSVFMSVRRYKEVGYLPEEVDSQCIRGEEVGQCINMRGVVLRGKITGASGKRVEFDIGGALEDVDVIIYATGYSPTASYYMMDKPLRLDVPSGYPDYWYEELYRDVIWGKNPRLSYVGVTMNLYTLPEFEIEAQLVARMAAGIVKLPTPAHFALDRTSSYRSMMKLIPWWEDDNDEEWGKLSDQDGERIEMEAQANRMLSKIEGAALSPERESEWKILIGKMKAFWATNWELKGSTEHAYDCPCAADKNFVDVNGAFRDGQFPGVHGAVEQPPHHTSYITSLDDSAACFMDQTKCRK